MSKEIIELIKGVAKLESGQKTIFKLLDENSKSHKEIKKTVDKFMFFFMTFMITATFTFGSVALGMLYNMKPNTTHVQAYNQDASSDRLADKNQTVEIFN